MMITRPKKINTVIIDDDEGYLFSLKEHLSFFPEIEIHGCAAKYKQARTILEDNQLDLVFLDIEMPVKNGFELLQEIREAGFTKFKVVFFTVYDKYLINALRESAFDYLLKPVRKEDLAKVIERYKRQNNLDQKVGLPLISAGASEIISLPTITGIRFLDKNSILFFECSSETILEKKCWKAILSDRSHIKLRTQTSAIDILDFVGKTKFLRLNPSSIVNVNFLSSIEFSTRKCQLLPPYNDIIITASRSNMAEIRERFDVL